MTPQDPLPPFRDPKPTPERISQLAQRVLVGDILLPRFQRGFVWESQQILDLLDSIRRNYPIGSMLLWQSSQELSNVRTIADLHIAEHRPGYPVNYLLDGQQRLSTICGALHWQPGNPDSLWNLAYDLKQRRFIHLDFIDEPPLHLTPLRYLSNPSAYFSRLISLPEDLQQEARRLFDRFTDYQTAVVTLGDMSIRDVAPVFERINSTGTRLTIVDLMRAATWSLTFDLVDAVDDAREQLEPKHFSEIDRKTLLRSVAAAAGFGFSVAAMDALRDRAEDDLRNDVAATLEAAKRAADFLATQIGAPESKALPYVNQFAVLTELFRQLPHPTDEQFWAIRRWFWKTTLSGYFGGWNTGQMAVDRQAITDFACGQSAEVANSGVIPQATVWSLRNFRSNSATSKMLALMLAHEQPVDILTDQRIDVGKSLSWSNDKEYHHFFPKAYLQRREIGSRVNAVANIVLLTSHSNLQIRDRAPSEYLGALREQLGTDELKRRLELSLVPEAAMHAALSDDYSAFLAERSKEFHRRAMELVGGTSEREGATPTQATTDDSDVDPPE